MESLVLHVLDLLWDVCEMQKRTKTKRIKSGGAAVVPGAGTGAVVVPGTAAMVSDLFFFSFVPYGCKVISWYFCVWLLFFPPGCNNV